MAMKPGNPGMNIGMTWWQFRIVAASAAALLFSACGERGGCGGIAPSPRTVSVTPAELSLDVGARSTVAAVVGGECVEGRTAVRYVSSDPGVATVTSAGEVGAVAAGSATITASSVDFGIAGVTRLTVRPPAVQSLVLSTTALTLRERRSAVLRVTVETTGRLTRSVRFVSSAAAVATVTPIDSVSATISGITAGVADIEIVADGDVSKRATLRVTVEAALVASVAIAGDASSDSIVLASARQLAAVVTDSTGTALADRTLTWSSSNPAVLAVSGTGEIRALAGGTAVISVTVPIGDGSGVRAATKTLRAVGSLQLAVTPPTAVVDEGQTIRLTATVVASAGIARGVTWESSNIGRATVTPSGDVTGLLSSTTPIVIRARSVALATVVDSSLVSVQARAIPTVLDLRPAVDTLSPQGTRTLTATVRDQRNNVIAGAAVVWRSLTPSLASVSAGGVVTALANGSALITAASPRTSPADSLRDTTTVLIAPPCSLIRPIAFGETYRGAFTVASCRNFVGFPTAEQFSLTSATQRTYAIRLTPTFVASLVPLALGSGFFGLPSTDTTVVGLAVMRAGRVSFFVTAPSSAVVGSYTFTVTENPNPALNCVPTDVTRAVSFETAMVPVTCQSRDIRILPALGAGVRINLTGTAPAFPVQIELREFGTNSLLASALANSSGATAAISFLNPTFRFTYLRVIGPNGTVRVTID